jgi:hypothetical protein
MLGYVLREAPHSTLADMAAVLGVSREYARNLCDMAGAERLLTLGQAAAEIRRLKAVIAAKS